MKKTILISVLILAAVLRFYRLGEFPTGLNADEAALGYNSYSLLLTGKDEHGHPWPVNLESFGDFKPAGYAYLLIPFIKVFGLTEFAVRLPSAIFGVLAVLFIYLLIKELTSSEVWACLGALLLAISPWHLHFSRGAWEVNVATTLILIGTWCFVKWLKNKKLIYLLLFTINFSLSAYTYQSARIIAPLMVLGLATIYFRDLIKYPKQVISNFLLLLLLLLPLAKSVVTSDAGSRLSGVGLLADEGPLNRVKEFRGHHPSYPLVNRLLHNRPVIYSIQFIKNYFDHFNGNFLFVNGDIIERNRVPETGLFYLTDFAFLTLGAFYLFKFQTSNFKLVWLWLFISPIASALTFQTPHALRAQNMVIPMTIVISSGVHYLISKSKVLLLLLFTIYSWQFARYLHQYYIHYPQTYPSAWEYGFKELVSYVQSVQDEYKQIWITDKYDQPYILFLFYSRYPPQKFQNNHVLTLRDRFNFSTVRDYDKYHFESTPWEKVRDVHSTLIIAAPEDIPGVGVNIVKTIYFPNNKPVFKIISN